MDGLRAIAILLVIGVHWVQPYLPVARGGYVGVDVFFVLSGYIITKLLWTAGQNQNGARTYRQFMLRRAKRLLPALIFFLTVATLIIAIVGSPVSGSAAIGGASLALAQGMSIYKGLGLGDSPFAHTWSLANEWIFYVVWPALLIWARARRLSALVLAGIAIMLAVIFYLISLPSSADWFYYGPTSRASQILLGCAIALYLEKMLKTSPQMNDKLGNAIVIASVGALVLWTVLGSGEKMEAYRWVGFPLAAFATGAIITVGAIDDRLWTLRPLRSPAFVKIGQVSYSLYLWHLLPMQVLDKDNIDLPTPLLAAGAVLFVAVVTLSSYWLFERPSLRRRSATAVTGAR
nr:acyltransferase [Microcella alkalica]